MTQENAISTDIAGSEEKPVANELVAKRSRHLDDVLTAASGGWLKEIWGKWPGEESIEELLAALKESG